MIVGQVVCCPMVSVFDKLGMRLKNQLLTNWTFNQINSSEAHW